MAYSTTHRSRARNQIVIPDYSICYHCKEEGLEETNTFCPNCGFPQFGTQLEQRKFILNFRKQKTKIRKTKESASRARYMLIFAGIVKFFMFIGWGPIVLLIGLIISSIYIGLGIWSKKKPLPAILTGLIFFITLNTFLAIIDYRIVLSDLFLNIPIFFGLIIGLFSVLYSEKIKKEIDYRKAV
jgi:RNA polymerase subunit RPABC4/transcription elongation factor Spt4